MVNTIRVWAEAHTQNALRILRQASSVPVWSITIMLVLAVGFGAQTLAKDVITGFFILLEDQVRVGDAVTAAGCSGVVEAVNLRTTVLRESRRRVKKAFDDANIEIPFPHIKLVRDRDGAA